MDNWYVMHVSTGNEIEILNIIKRDIPEAVALVPQRIMKERKDGKWKIQNKVLFPGYVFIGVLLDAAMYYRLDAIPHMIRFLGSSDGPEPVPEYEMAIVLRLSGDGDPLGISDIYYEGSRIVVKSGPLEGMEGQIIKVDARRFRAKVNISLMGEQRVVELGVNVIDKIEA
jgi:transcriptional antiterminator NusG